MTLTEKLCTIYLEFQSQSINQSINQEIKNIFSDKTVICINKISNVVLVRIGVRKRENSAKYGQPRFLVNHRIVGLYGG